MTYKAANDLLNLVNLSIKGKMLFLGKTTEDSFSIIKALDTNHTGINISDAQIMDIKESYCQQIFFGIREPLIINDTHIHPLTSKLPITTSLNIRSYLGVPIFYNDGEMFGTLCTLDSKVSNFTEDDIETLKRFSSLFAYVIELEKQIKYDPLTELHNRKYLYDNFEYVAKIGTVMLLDLDGFKQVNDQYGHDVGDMVLKEVGNRIKHSISINDIGVRLGGDEFVLVFPNLIEQKKIEEKANQLLEIIADWRKFQYPINVSVSIGIVTFPTDGTEIQTILKKADTAMYQAKINGKNSYHFFN